VTERPEVTVQVRGARNHGRREARTLAEMIGHFAGYEDYQRRANRDIPVVVLERQ
jgi:hypothetical protein